ncbi:MAG: hypothetical protein M0D57_10515 [Sphingobacteriales bacterium JAD_PAG50586_3]|nr:MAG: hypothetical protein M0D57_10515 [Sphingobacteriales bacterium JAD_PAG50586_3]
MQKILHVSEIESATIRINCDSNAGSAFIISSKDGQCIVLSSDHNIIDNKPVILSIGGEEIEAEILERIPERDVVILRLELLSEQTIHALPMKSRQIAYDEKWETFGYPAMRIGSGGRYNGLISRTNDGSKWDIDLECEQYNNLDDFSGLSGAPLVIDGFVVGVIGYDIPGTFGATSLSSILENIVKNDIQIDVDEHKSIPQSIENDISTHTANEIVLQRINEVLEENKARSYFLISGSPGSGKTTIAAQLEFENNNHIVCDRFFVKVPQEEEIPTQIRATPEFFLKWVEEIYHRILYNKPPAKSQKPLNEKIIEIHQGIGQLSNHYLALGKTAYLIVDGLDDVKVSQIEEFLSVLPIILPANFKILFSCTSKEILPANFNVLIDSEVEIKVTPLSLQNAKDYLSEKLMDRGITESQISELAEKSEGHPLYLRYLTKYVLNSNELSTISEWINQIPTISGEIENYYNKLWSQLEGNNDTLWLMATLSRLRIPINKEILLEILPETTKHHFITSFNKIQHLLKDDTNVSIYHTSFSDFINKNSALLEHQIHDNITEYNLSHPDVIFGISERIYHLANGSEVNRRKAIDECNQHWADACAFNSISPDVVLSDIKKVIGLAAEFGISHKVISLLLLSQRINFRYNVLFHGNALFLVNALISIDKPEEAIRYVVRNKTLTTSDNDALFLLQKFYENGNLKEAGILQEAIDDVCSNLLQNGFDKESFNRYISIKFKAVILSSNIKKGQAFEEFMHYKRHISKMIEVSGNSDEILDWFRNDVSSSQTGYVIWRYNSPPISGLFEQHNPENIDNNLSGLIAQSIYKALEYEMRSPVIKPIDQILPWITDLENVIDKYGLTSDNNYLILYVLLGRSRRIDLMKAIFHELYPHTENLNFRTENGVDLNYKSLQNYGLYSECIGFFDDSDNFPVLNDWAYHINWEINFKSLFNYICFLSGKLANHRLEGIDINNLHIRVQSLFALFIPDLKLRISWKRAYALPEAAYPFFYSKLIPLLASSFPEILIQFVEDIVGNKYYQLGLYTEGYIESLFTIASALAKKSDFEVQVFKVAKVLETHIINTVENREERNEYLLRLVELYGQLKNQDKASEVFKEVINTSMGPSWYKESQLGIINTTISNIIPKDGDTHYLHKFAAHLHNASGEMTFQRYVKQQQESFVGDLAKIGFTQDAILYLKYLLLPDYKTVVANAESGLVDMPFKGYGYILGARAIEEQSTVLNLLQSVDSSNSIFAWGLCELFILGDDRYVDEYAKILTTILNSFEINDPTTLEFLIQRVSKFAITEVSDEFRNKFLRDLLFGLTESNYSKIKNHLKAFGMQPERENKNSDGYQRPDDYTDPLNILVVAKDKAKKQIEIENLTGARETIIEALQSIQVQKYSIWSSNYSNKINEIRELLSQTFTNSSDFIRHVKNLIIDEPYFEEWIIANQLIEIFKNINEESEKQHILDAVLDHINLMVRTPQLCYDRYSWMKNPAANGLFQKDEILLELLIWFLNHPSLVVKNRTTEILVWIGTIIPKPIIESLIKEIITDGYQISRELAASILHQLAILNPHDYGKLLMVAIEENEEKLLSINHFMIRDSIIASLLEISKNGTFAVDETLSKFDQTFATSNANAGDIILDEDYLKPISLYLDELNELNFLSREFAELLLRQIEVYAPLPINESKKASRYIDRSFNDHNDITLVPDFNNILRFALNEAVSLFVVKDDREKVADVLRFYQPTFPENKLIAGLGDEVVTFENEIRTLFNLGGFKFENLLIEGNIVLNYFSNKFSDIKRNDDEKFELTSYLVPIDNFISANKSYIPSFFASNCYPSAPEEGLSIPLFIKSDNYSKIIGSDFVPSVVNTFSNIIPAHIIQNIKERYWRRGRNWNQNRMGEPQNSGYYSTISMKQLLEFRGNYKLVLQIGYGYKFKYIDVFEQIEIA